MPVAVRIDPEADRVTVTVRGTLAAAEIETALEAMYSDDEFRPGMNQLWDLRAGAADVSPQEVQRIVLFVQSHREARGKGRTAVVVPRDADFGLARVAQVYLEMIDVELMVFRTMDEAERWLAGEGKYRPQWLVRPPETDSNSKAG